MIYDPELTLSLLIQSMFGHECDSPHAVEALYARLHPLSLMALEAIIQLAQALPEIVQAPHNMQAREPFIWCMVGWCVLEVRWGWQFIIKFAIAYGGRYQLHTNKPIYYVGIFGALQSICRYFYNESFGNNCIIWISNS